MADAIIKELWAIKDAIAREHDYDVTALVAALRKRSEATGGQTVDLSRPRSTASKDPKS